MTYKNFKVETDADGIAVVTWDIPGKSMNVLDETTGTELAAIVEATTKDAAVKGVVFTSGKAPSRLISAALRGHGVRFPASEEAAGG